MFLGVYIKRTTVSTHSSYLIIKGQGLHLSALQHIEDSRCSNDGYFLADLSYDIVTKKYDLCKKESVIEPTLDNIAEASYNIANVLRAEGLYRAEYGGNGLTFSQMNN